MQRAKTFALEGHIFSTTEPHAVISTWVPVDRYVRDRLPGDRYVRDRLPGDRYVRDRLPGDRYVHDRLPGDRNVRDRLPGDRYVRDRLPGDRYVRDRFKQHPPRYFSGFQNCMLTLQNSLICTRL